MADQTFRDLFANIKIIKAGPDTRTINGIGGRLCGQISIPGSGKNYITALWFTVFFLPLFPVSIYLMKDTSAGAVFVGKSTFSDAFSAFGWKFLWLIVTAWIEGLAMCVALAALFALVFGMKYLIRQNLH